MEDFEPIIIAFCCSSEDTLPRTWQVPCVFRYPGNIRIIRVPCTGKVDLIHLLRSFEKGADGVYVWAAWKGTAGLTTATSGPAKGWSRPEILDTSGIGGERVQMFNLSSGEGPRFVRDRREMTEKIKEMGPNPMKIAKKKAA